MIIKVGGGGLRLVWFADWQPHVVICGWWLKGTLGMDKWMVGEAHSNNDSCKGVRHGADTPSCSLQLILQRPSTTPDQMKELGSTRGARIGSLPIPLPSNFQVCLDFTTRLLGFSPYPFNLETASPIPYYMLLPLASLYFLITRHHFPLCYSNNFLWFYRQRHTQ